MSRTSELLAIAVFASHCTDPQCRKCGARRRWARRKAWHTSKSPIRKASERK